MGGIVIGIAGGWIKSWMKLGLDRRGRDHCPAAAGYDGGHTPFHAFQISARSSHFQLPLFLCMLSNFHFQPTICQSLMSLPLYLSI